jgi:hypothetical protein
MVMMSLDAYEKELDRMEAKGRKGLFEDIYRQLMPSEGSMLTLVRTGGRIQIAVGEEAVFDGSPVLYDPTVSGSGMTVPTGKFGGASHRGIDIAVPGLAETVVDKTPAIAVGWYQDGSGNLSHFNGQSWSRDKKTPKVDVSKLEYLGE